MNSSVTPETTDTALVLGGGGSTGNAWLIGVVAGLQDAGVGVSHADLTIGTSAGATATAQLGSTSAADLFDAAVSSPVPASGGKRASAPVGDHLERLRSLISASADAADYRRRLGAAALDRAAESDGSWQEQWRTTVASRLPNAEWPQNRVLITAVDASTGELAAFDSASGVSIVDAVAASCASGPPYRIGDRWCIDGGFWRSENADLATGYARVLVLSPFGGRTLAPLSWGMDLATQVDELRAAGSRVLTISPKADSEHLFGVNAMDVSLRPAAAKAGHDQGRSMAEEVSRLWSA